MSQTTLDIDASILRELEQLQEAEKKPLSQIVTELVREALALRQRPEVSSPSVPARISWISRPMEARVDLADKERIHAILDASTLD